MRKWCGGKTGVQRANVTERENKLKNGIDHLTVAEKQVYTRQL